MVLYSQHEMGDWLSILNQIGGLCLTIHRQWSNASATPLLSTSPKPKHWQRNLRAYHTARSLARRKAWALNTSKPRLRPVPLAALPKAEYLSAIREALALADREGDLCQGRTFCRLDGDRMIAFIGWLGALCMAGHLSLSIRTRVRSSRLLACFC